MAMAAVDQLSNTDLLAINKLLQITDPDSQKLQMGLIFDKYKIPPILGYYLDGKADYDGFTMKFWGKLTMAVCIHLSNKRVIFCDHHRKTYIFNFNNRLPYENQFEEYNALIKFQSHKMFISKFMTVRDYKKYLTNMDIIDILDWPYQNAEIHRIIPPEWFFGKNKKRI